MKDAVAKASQLIDCTVEDASDAFVDPAKITRFWLASTSEPLSAGASARWHFMVPGAVETTVVEVFEPPGTIAFAWSDGTKVRLAFTAHAPGRTRVSVEATVAGADADDALEQAVDATEGFSIVLCDLKTFLESGRSANLVRAKAELIASGMAGSAPDA